MTPPADHPVDLDSLSIWNATVRVRVDTRFAKTGRRYVTQREASALLGELMSAIGILEPPCDRHIGASA